MKVVKCKKPLIEQIEDEKWISEANVGELRRIFGIVNQYECNPFDEWSEKELEYPTTTDFTWIPTNWVEFFQARIANDCCGEPEESVREQIGLLRFNFWRASVTGMPIKIMEDYWIRNNNYPDYKYLKKMVNPVLKDVCRYSESIWAVTYGQEHSLVHGVSGYDKELIFTGVSARKGDKS